MTDGVSSDRGRSNARRLTIFNHKGGVGKTTLSVNIGAALAELGRRVLLVDTDPQCNLTSYLVDSDVVDDLLDNSDTVDGRTVWSAVKPISEALGEVVPVDPIELGIDGMYLIPGDIRLSEFESDLNDFWSQCLQRKARGFRGTTAISDLVSACANSLAIDYVLYDAGPNIGPLNRVIVLDCDDFIVPVAADLFSVRALKTLGRSLVDWINNWDAIADLAPAGTRLLPGKPRFLGYIPEGFRVYGGLPTSDQSPYLSQIERDIHSQVVALLREIDGDLVTSRASLRLGEVKHFGALVPASQREGTPLYNAHAGSAAQREEAHTALRQIAGVIDAELFGGDG
jgi:cellulose biosynthesis protein BcsQ